MKIGRISFEVAGSPVVVDNIETENLEDFKNLITTLIEESRYASSICYYKKVCTDFPKKCAEYTQRPNKSYFSKTMLLFPQPSKSKVER